VIYGDLPPEVRRLQYDAFLSGENDILITTDAIGMGVNLPIKRIIFTELEKFDGEQFRILTSQEIKQIAGRAGRIGIYDIGYVACTEADNSFIENGLRIPDEEITKAVVGPSEAILNISILPLKEKLALWSTKEESLDYYRRKDVRDLILILDKLQPYRLPENVQWRLMELPFDVHSEELLRQFTIYADEIFLLKTNQLSKPELSYHTLSAYEAYYQKINLYYSFSKSLNLNFDEQWVYDYRKHVCDEINSLLSCGSDDGYKPPLYVRD
jgi:ATP-dependent RNA helicase SUPV3L1/SUV3